ncbi:MAG: hypothetical protein U1E20_13005 [Methylocystis sp.]|uniref:hypothetical protein n=1 Tax=Methylocystis sp. TaxID=1911079 RepID=UPI0039578A24
MGSHLEEKFAAAGARSRRLLVDAAVCFVATSLVAVVPPQWKNGEALKEMVFTTDPVSGKIIDRLLSDDPERGATERDGAAPTPAVVTVYPREHIYDWSNEIAPVTTETRPAKPTKVAASRKPSAETRNPVESTPRTPPTKNAEPVAQTTGESADQPERSFLAKFDPTGLPSKLAPLGQKVWNGATSLTGAVSGFVNAYRF